MNKNIHMAPYLGPIKFREEIPKLELNPEQ